ncbi:TPA: hypothetical protein ACRZ4F_001605 [Vibrio harveyi]
MATNTLQRKRKKTKGQFVAIPNKKGSDAVVDAIADNIEQLTGLRGPGNKKAVLWEDLEALGFAKLSNGRLRKSFDLSKIGGKGGGNKGGSVTVNGDPVENPTTPKNVVARSGFNLATITWDTPTYKGHAYAKVFQSLDDNFSNATVVATTPSSIFSTPIEPNKDYYYWVKFVNIVGKESPINAVHGAHARAVIDPKFFLDLIAKEVAKNPNFIPVPDALGGLDISGLPDAQQIADLDKLLAEAIIQNSATVDKQVRELKVGERTLRATIERDYYTIVKVDKAIAGAATRLKTEIESPKGKIMSALNQNFVTKTGLNKAISSVSQSLGSRIGKNDARLTTIAQTIGNDAGLRALWTVKADIGDLHASVGLIAKSAADMSQASAQFVVRNADFRVVYDADGNGSNPSKVATVFGTIVNPAYTKWVHGGKKGPAPTKYILAINTASIKVANIKDLVAGDIVADKVLAQALIESPRIRTPVINSKGSNFYVNAAGNVDMNRFTARAGTLRDRLSLVGGSYIDGRASQHFLNSRNDKFYVTHDGYLYAEDGIFKGTIYADHIVGDVVSAISAEHAHVTCQNYYTPYDSIEVVNPRPYPRTLVVCFSMVPRVEVVSENERSGYGLVTGQARITGDFGTVYSHKVSTRVSGVGAGSQYAEDENTYLMMLPVTIPPNSSGKMEIQGRVTNTRSNWRTRTYLYIKGVGGNTWTAQLYRNGGDLKAGSN